MKNYERRITILSIMLAGILLIAGISYAYFSAMVTGSETSTTITADSGSMSIVYSDGNPAVVANNITPEMEPFATKTFTVTGTNTSTTKFMPYSLSLVVDENTFTSNAISYTLQSTNTSNNGAIAPSNVNTPIFTGKSNNGLGSGYFDNGTNKVHTYTLKVYFLETDRDQSVDMNKTFKAHVVITSEKAMNLAPDNWNESKSGSLLYALKTNNNLSTPLTAVGDASLATEAVMAATPDDYGTSYYFRGAVENNYIVFANMCWRIVRVTGDGSIKLALYNYNPNSVANPCDAAQDGTTNAFARYTGTTYTTKFNTNYDDNAYVGFMYGATGASTYAATHANTNKSTILTNLETWYASKLSSYSANLADTIWCNDKSTTGLGYGTNNSYYGAYTRINAKNASLICPKDNNGGSLSKFTADDTTNGNVALTYKIGLLTADEMVYSGTPDWNSSNTTQYLYKNTGGSYYWSLSPFDYYGHAGVSGGADGVYGGNVSATLSLRPSVSLVSGTQITGGGTSSNPFKTV